MVHSICSGDTYVSTCLLLHMLSCKLQGSVDINVKTYTATATPLHLAAGKSHWGVLECLVGWGAALDPVNKDGNTPLQTVTSKRSSVIPESPQLNQVQWNLSLN